MSNIDSTSTLASLEATIGAQMGTAIEMIADTLDSPAMDLDRYDRYITVAEACGPTYVLALIRTAAGIAAATDLTGDQVRALAAP